MNKIQIKYRNQVNFKKWLFLHRISREMDLIAARYRLQASNLRDSKDSGFHQQLKNKIE
jgi:hypothetical protein